ncbi:MAG: hypothetical protein EBS36_03710 [Actinobacteria bacterium]|nr:hypothetical protein [Actinomycetota bacterium]NBY15661.1 hypothetical protein [Actinomycetota bacterium]
MPKLLPDEVPDCTDQTPQQVAELAQYLAPYEQELMLMRSLVAQDLTTPIRILELLAHDPKRIVRHSVAHNPMATEAIADIAMRQMSTAAIPQEGHAWKQMRYQYKSLPLERLLALFDYKSVIPFYPARYRPAIIRALPKGTVIPDWNMNELVVSGPTRVHLALLKRVDLIQTERDWWTICQAADPEVRQAIQDAPDVPEKWKRFARQLGGLF